MNYLSYINHSLIVFGSVFAGSFLLLFWGRKLVLSKLSKISARTETKIDDLIVGVLDSIKVFFIVAVSVYLGTQFLDAPNSVIIFIYKIIFVLIIFQVAVTASQTIGFFMETYILHNMSKDASNAAIIGIAVFTVKLIVYLILLLLVLNNFGIDVTALIAGLGIGGIAIALAIQNILGDLFASFTIILDKPFLVGDFIIVGEHMGTVEKIGIKTTRVRSLSGEQLIFPNGQLLQGQIRNFKRMQERRVVFNIGVVYQTPLEKIKAIPGIIGDAIKDQQKARLDRTHFKAYGDFSLIFETVYWVEDPDFTAYMNIQQSINLKIFERFQKEGIEFAYPTQTIYGSINGVQSVS